MIFFWHSIMIFASFNFLTILASQTEQNSDNILPELSIKSKKRNLNSLGEEHNIESVKKSRRSCDNPGLNSRKTDVFRNTKIISNKPDNTILNLFIFKKKTKKVKVNTESKNIKLTSQLFTYSVPSYTFTIDFKSLVENNKRLTTSNQTINSLDELNVNNLINCFTSVFCKVQSFENDKTFTIKKEFEFLALTIPELIPFIIFINRFKSSFREILLNYDQLSAIQIFNIDLDKWVGNYLKIFDNEFLSKNTGNKILITYKRNMDEKHILHYSKFKELIIDFLEILNADSNLIKSYKFLKILHDYKIIMKRCDFDLNISFFIYFLTASGSESKNYLEKFDKYNHIVDDENLTSDKIENAYKFIEYSIDFKILKSSLNEYEQLISTINMPLFNIKEHLDKFVDFDKGRFTGLYFYYDVKCDKKYERRVYFLQLWKLFYLNFLAQVFRL